jgi:hypothetical protein
MPIWVSEWSHTNQRSNVQHNLELPTAFLKLHEIAHQNASWYQLTLIELENTRVYRSVFDYLTGALAPKSALAYRHVHPDVETEEPPPIARASRTKVVPHQPALKRSILRPHLRWLPVSLGMLLMLFIVIAAAYSDEPSRLTLSIEECCFSQAETVSTERSGSRAMGWLRRRLTDQRPIAQSSPACPVV